MKDDSTRPVAKTSGIHGVTKLPRLVEACEAEGLPVIIVWQGLMPEHVQRLYASLGVLVRFVD